MENKIYKGYNLVSWGTVDDRLKSVIDGGEIVKAAETYPDGTRGNWDLIMLNDTIYYMALAASGAESGTWGNKKHFYKMYGVKI